MKSKANITNIIYMWNLKNDASELIYRTETDTENRLMATKWNMQGGIN